jgi:hypothetical protein
MASLVCAPALGCRRPAPQERSASAATPSTSTTPRVSAVRDPGALPEDPVAGARAVEQWREHLEEEERQRKANYDRRHMKEHRELLALLRSTQARYDQAKTATAVKQIQAGGRAGLDALRARVDKIDHWRVSSSVVSDYEALLDALASSYPAARLSELEGAPASGVRGDFEARLKHIDERLAAAEQAEDE